MMTARDLTVACEAVNTAASDDDTGNWPARYRLRRQAARMGMGYGEIIEAAKDRIAPLVENLRAEGIGLSPYGEEFVGTLLASAWADGVEVGQAYRRLGGELREPEHSFGGRMARLLRGTR